MCSFSRQLPVAAIREIDDQSVYIVRWWCARPIVQTYSNSKTHKKRLSYKNTSTLNNVSSVRNAPRSVSVDDGE